MASPMSLTHQWIGVGLACMPRFSISVPQLTPITVSCQSEGLTVIISSTYLKNMSPIPPPPPHFFQLALTKCQAGCISLFLFQLGWEKRSFELHVWYDNATKCCWLLSVFFFAVSFRMGCLDHTVIYPTEALDEAKRSIAAKVSDDIPKHGQGGDTCINIPELKQVWLWSRRLKHSG